MAESIKQDDIDALVSQMQEGNAALADATEAAKEAAAAADEIAAAAQSVAPAAPVAAPAVAPAVAGSAPIEGESGPADVVADMRMEEPAAEAMGGAFSPEVKNILAIEVPVIVQLGRRKMAVGEVMRFAVGAIIEFQKSAEEELELLANNRPIGAGHAVKVGENFGIKITKIGSVKEVIRQLGGV